jgi:hypothetical protein
MAQDWSERQRWRNEDRRRMAEEERRCIGEQGYGRERHAGQEGGRQFGQGWRGGRSEQDWARREELGRGREHGRGYDRDQEYESERHGRERFADYYDEPASGSRGGSRSYRDWNDASQHGRGYEERSRQGRGWYGQPEGGRGYEQTYGPGREFGRTRMDEGRVRGGGAWQSRGEHSGQGPKGYARSDDRIREDVCDRLTEDPEIDASNIEVSVSRCEVSLGGTVDSREAKRRAEDCAESVSGVRNVQNSLRVQQQGTEAGTASGLSDVGTRASGASGGKRNT